MDVRIVVEHDKISGDFTKIFRRHNSGFRRHNFLLDRTDLTLNLPYNGPYVEAPCERATLFRLQVYERVGKSVIEVYERNKRALRL